MKRALLLLLLLAGDASAGTRCTRGRGCDRGSGGGDDFVFEFAPSSGAGLPTAQGLCTASSAEMTGGYWCLKGDGTMSSGSTVAATTVGSPALQSLPTCPNGPDCSALNVAATPLIADYFTTASMASPTGDFSICWLGRPQAPPTVYDFIGRDTGGAGRSFYLTLDSAMHVDFTVFKSAGGLTALNGGSIALITGVRHLLCATYDYVADGTSVSRSYIDGVQDQVSTAAVGPIQANTQVTGVNARPGGFINGCLNCIVEGALFTEKVIDAATVAAMADAVLTRTPRSTQGHSVLVTRASTKFCAKSDQSAGTIIKNGQPCIRNSGLDVEGSSTNLVIRNTAFDNAAWTKTNVTAPTADTALAPDGTKTAESLTSTVAGGLVESTAAAITGTNGTASVFVRTAAGTQAVAIRLRDTTAGADRCTGTLTATTTWQRLSCSSVAVTTTNNHTVRIYPGDTGGTGTAVFWGAQMEADPNVSSVIATAGTSVARAIDQPITFSPRVVPSVTEGCTKMTIVPGWTGAAPVTLYLLNFNSSTNFRVPYISNAAQAFTDYDGTHLPNSNTTFTSGTPVTVRSTWSASANLLRVNSTIGGVAGTSVFTTMGAADSMDVMNIAGAGNMPSVLRDITIGSTSVACGSTP